MEYKQQLSLTREEMQKIHKWLSMPKAARSGNELLFRRLVHIKGGIKAAFRVQDDPTGPYALVVFRDCGIEIGRTHKIGTVYHGCEFSINTANGAYTIYLCNENWISENASNKYARGGGRPYCQGDDLDRETDFNTEATEVWRKVTCLLCCRTFIEVFTLSRVAAVD